MSLYCIFIIYMYDKRTYRYLALHFYMKKAKILVIIVIP